MPSIVVGPRTSSDQTNKNTYPRGTYSLGGYLIMSLSFIQSISMCFIYSEALLLDAY